MAAILFFLVILACVTNMGHASEETYEYRIIDKRKRHVRLECKNVPFHKIPSEISRDTFVDLNSPFDIAMPDDPKLRKTFRPPDMMYKVTEARMTFTKGFFTSSIWKQNANSNAVVLGRLENLSIDCENDGFRTYLHSHLKHLVSLEEIVVLGFELSSTDLEEIYTIISLRRMILTAPSRSINGTAKRRAEPTLDRRNKRRAGVANTDDHPIEVIYRDHFSIAYDLNDLEIPNQKVRSEVKRYKSRKKVVATMRGIWGMLKHNVPMPEFQRLLQQEASLHRALSDPNLFERAISSPVSHEHQLLKTNTMNPTRAGAESSQLPRSGSGQSLSLLSRTYSAIFKYLPRSLSSCAFIQDPLESPQPQPSNVYPASKQLILLRHLRDHVTLVWALLFGQYSNWDERTMAIFYMICLIRFASPASSCALKKRSPSHPIQCPRGLGVGLYSKSRANPANTFAFKVDAGAYRIPVLRRVSKGGNISRQNSEPVLRSPRRRPAKAPAPLKTRFQPVKGNVHSTNDMARSENDSENEVSAVPPPPSPIEDIAALEDHGFEPMTSPSPADGISEASAIAFIACSMTAFVLMMLALATRCTIYAKPHIEEEVVVQDSILVHQIGQFADAKRNQKGLPSVHVVTAGYCDDPHFSF